MVGKISGIIDRRIPRILGWKVVTGAFVIVQEGLTLIYIDLGLDVCY